MAMRRAVLACVLPVLLAGCVGGPQDCDPTRTLLFDGIACSMGGGYQQRQMALGRQQRAAEANAYWARADAAQAGQQQAAAEARLRSLQADVARQNRELAVMRRQLDQARAQRANPAAVQNAEARLAEAERMQPASRAELAEREAAQARARTAIRALQGL